MAVTIALINHQQEDKYYIIQSKNTWKTRFVNDKGNEYQIQPVTAEECDYGWWKQMPTRLRVLGNWVGSARIHGRRMNDEVELFEEPEKTPGLKADLERQGFKVRKWVPEPTEKKCSPKKKQQQQQQQQERITEKEKKEKTVLENCTEALDAALLQRERETDEPIEHGLIADPDCKTRDPKDRHLLIFIVSAEVVNEFDGKEPKETVTANGVKYNVIGTIERSHARFICDEEKARTFFTKTVDSEDLHVRISVFDHVVEKEKEAREALKQAKKAEKKQRRRRQQQQQQQQQAGAVAAQQSNNVYGALQDEDDEARKQARKEKEKARKKACRERKKNAKQFSTALEVMLAENGDEKGEGNNALGIVFDGPIWPIRRLEEESHKLRKTAEEGGADSEQEWLSATDEDSVIDEVQLGNDGTTEQRPQLHNDGQADGKKLRPAKSTDERRGAANEQLVMMEFRKV